ncbi:MAG: metallophosphoesterase [Polyangiaceae bacterium]
MPRTIIIGDIHGCRYELEELLAEVGVAEGDRVVSVGDTVVRGPDPAGALRVLRSVGALAVRGNHEDRLIRWWELRGTKQAPPIGDLTRKTARELSRADFAAIKAWPLWIDFPHHNLRVVHAGIAPGVPMPEQHPSTLMTIRCVTKDGEPVAKRGDHLWGAFYAGPPHVVFGHNARPEPQIHPWATGIDTGCVYGGRLTAMVLEDGAEPPPIADRASVLVSVPARRAYVKI